MTRERALGMLVLTAALGIACEENVRKADPAKPGASAKASASAPASAAASNALPKVDFQESEFTENERSRDPFRTFAEMFVAEARDRVKSQREVVLDQYALDELKLIGIVTGTDQPVAMLVDPTGKGHVVKRGQFVGRAETVQAPGATGAVFEVNWRVDRIRDGDIVLVREDPANPDVPGATKVLPLRPDGATEKRGRR